MDTTLRHCSTCGGEQLFERPPCQDGHGDCPEWVCLGCGFAVLVGVLEAAEPPPGVAPHRGVAA